MENKVIEFPKRQTVRKRIQERAQDQKAVLTLSIASVLILSLFLNQLLISPSQKSNSQTGNRQIASFDGSASQDLKWEQDLAKKLSQNDLKENLKLAEKPTLRDDLVFGFLHGKYGMKLNNDKIESLEFIDAQVGEEPLKFDKKSEFLLKYKGVFGVTFNEVSMSNQQGKTELYSLIAEDKSVVGSVQFNLDDQGRVLSLLVK